MDYSTVYKFGRTEHQYKGNLEWMSFDNADKDFYFTKLSELKKEKKREFKEIVRFTIIGDFRVKMVFSQNELCDRKLYALKYVNGLFKFYYKRPTFVDEQKTMLTPADRIVKLEEMIRFKVFE